MSCEFWSGVNCLIDFLTDGIYHLNEMISFISFISYKLKEIIISNFCYSAAIEIEGGMVED